MTTPLVGAMAREEMMKSRLPSSVLRRIWALSDIDQDGQLDRDEFAVAMFLIDHKLAGNDLPDKLPDRMIPPSKRSYLRQGIGYMTGSSARSRPSTGGAGSPRVVQTHSSKCRLNRCMQ